MFNLICKKNRSPTLSLASVKLVNYMEENVFSSQISLFFTSPV
jgi:hypothetical protein